MVTSLTYIGLPVCQVTFKVLVFIIKIHPVVYRELLLLFLARKPPPFLFWSNEISLRSTSVKHQRV